MTERYVDKKIKVLEEICRDNFKDASVSNYGLGITDDELIAITREFQNNWLLDIEQMSQVSDDEGYCHLNLRIKDEKGLLSLLSKLKKDYPKKDKPAIREKTLEKISIHFGNILTGLEIIALLTEWGVPKSLIEYPNTKWKMIFSILNHYSISAKREDYEMLKKIIEEIVHPLMHSGNKEDAQIVVDGFNDLLYFDNFSLEYSTKDKKYNLTYEPTEEEENQFYEMMHDEWQVAQRANLELLRKPENKEKIAIVRKAYQLLINITETFCQNPSSPTTELNNAYIKIKELTRKNASELKIIGNIQQQSFEYFISNFYFPFSNLFSAEAEYKNRSPRKIDWDEIRPELHRTYGEIDAIFREVNGSDILSEPDIQKMLNDASLLVSETKKKNEALKANIEKPQQPIQKIEIVNGRMEIEGLQEGLKSISQNKKGVKNKFPYSLPAGTEWKNIIFQFENDNNIYIQVKQYKHYTDYKDMGFLGKGKNPKPSEAWNFLNVLSKQNGEISIKDSEAKDVYKHHKQKLADMLKYYFSIDSDPFYPYADNKSYRIKLTLLPPHTNSLNKSEPKKKKEDSLGLDEFYKEQAREV